MKRRALLAVCGLIWLVATPTGAHAQDDRERWPLSVELNLGISRGWTDGEYLGGGAGVLLDALVAYRWSEQRGVVVGLGYGVQPGAVHASICKVPASGAGCVPHWPVFSTIGPLAGWESDTRNLRALTGPVFATGVETAGWQGRLDGFVPIAARISFSGTAQMLTIPHYRGDTFQHFALGIGLRIR